MSLGWRRNVEVEGLSSRPCSAIQLLGHQEGVELATGYLIGSLNNTHAPLCAFQS